MPGHHLVTGDTFQHSVHDRPLWCGFRPASFGLFLRKFHNLRHANVTLQLSPHNKNTTPHNPPRLGNALHRPAAQTEIHRRLALTRRSLPSADEMSRWRRTGNQKHPNVFTATVDLAGSAPPQIMQRVLRRPSEFYPEAIRGQRVQPGAFVHFVKVRHRLAGKQLPAIRIPNRRSIDVVQHTLGEIAGRRQILETLLVLNADRGTTELIRNPHGRDVHFALQEHLRLGQVGFLVGPELKFYALFSEPGVNLSGLPIANILHRSEQGRLAQALFE